MESSINFPYSSLLWGVFRNFTNQKENYIFDTFSLTGAEKGVFPIDSFQQIFLEVPKTEQKYNLIGRYNWLASETDRQITWFDKRVIHLPVYNCAEKMELSNFKEIIRIWRKFTIPESIPCINFATKIKGTYNSDGREGQLVLVLLLWPNGVSRIIQLDYFEGPLEDCCTPEWYINSSGLTSLAKSIDLINQQFSTMSNWANVQYSLFQNPILSKGELQGNHIQTNKQCWSDVWEYENFSIFHHDIQSVLSDLRELFK